MERESEYTDIFPRRHRDDQQAYKNIFNITNRAMQIETK